MITVAIITRRLKEGKSYEDFRKLWFHTVGFGTGNKMYSMLNMFDPREVIVVGLVEAPDLESLAAGLKIEVGERLANPLDEVIEPEIGRTFAVLVSEDDFSAEGSVEYQPASIGGAVVDTAAVEAEVAGVAALFARAAEERERGKAKRDG
jgi:hypothetical protein